MEYARSVGTRLMMHQDSDANPAPWRITPRFDYLHAFDLGQDTDFEKLQRLCPKAAVNCVLFPSWVGSSSANEVRAELSRLMQLGRRFPSFSFSLLEVDTKLNGDPLFALRHFGSVPAIRSSK